MTNSMKYEPKAWWLDGVMRDPGFYRWHAESADWVAVERPKSSRFQDIKEKLRVVYGVSLKRVDDEFRVVLRGRPEATAYYTFDLGDAFATGVTMALQAHPIRDYRGEPVHL